MACTLARRSVLTGLGATAVAGAALAAAAPASAEAHGDGQPLIGRAKKDQLHVMSFNIRYDRSGAGDTQPGDADHWPDRRPLVVDLLEREQPTVLGVQEAKFGQLSAIEEALPRHRYVGYGRHGGSQDEHSALFYDAERLELLAWDQFWLSGTPDVIGSSTWGNEISRLVVWARLRDRGSGTEFAVVNTHLDHRSAPARLRSAEVMVELLEGDELAGLPVLVTGDFNAVAEDSEPYSALVHDGPLQDTWETAEEHLTPAWGTFPNYDEPEEGARRIDWVLTSPDVRVQQAGINIWRDGDGAFPSDHVPVQALVSLP